MDEGYSIGYVDRPEKSERGIIGRVINTYNRQQADEDHFGRWCFALQAPDESMAGGVIGETYWCWLHVDLLWVQGSFRGRGCGHRLLTVTEKEARKRSAQNATPDTFSFQVLDFYQRRGYRVSGELSGFPPGHQRYFLTKNCSSDESSPGRTKPSGCSVTPGTVQPEFWPSHQRE
jgi:GNAT superfamily N-acetyltransferase